MKVRVTDVHPSPQGLVLGCVIEGPGGAWIKFALTRVEYDQIPESAIRGWVMRADAVDSDSLWEQLDLEFD